ncbi:MAG: CHAP domain-containing protein [Flavobacteriales bacterium]|jgi:surface antigen|nr:CHAP domain-containing protein [Flavobacteriales bacterium]
MSKRLVVTICLLLCLASAFVFRNKLEVPGTLMTHNNGDRLDSLNGVVVFHNAGMGNVSGRNVVDGYNVGLKYQCVEFVKRYYLEHYSHRMSNSYGHAKDFFSSAITDGEINPDRGLLQYTNGSKSLPMVGDLVVLDGWKGNPYGHVAIISAVDDGEVELVQQNTGSTRVEYDLDLIDGRWRIDNIRILGWLRMP